MKYLYFLIISALVLFACQKDATKDLDKVEPPAPEYITTSLQGKVLDENHNPVEGSAVKFGKSTTTTNNQGVFRFDGVDIDIHTCFVRVSKPGYFNGFRTFIASEGILNFVQLELLPKRSAGQFQASSGGTVAIPEGGSVTFTDGGIVRASDNAVYTGNVYVSAHIIDPTSPSIQDIMPGNMIGINAAGKERGLESFGMVGVELTGDGGEQLQLAPGKPATLTLGIPASLVAGAPAAIPLWYFDKTRGVWKEEGTAKKQGSCYVGKVNHFSFWNCDVPSNVVKFEASVKTTSGNPLANVCVLIKDLSSSASGAGNTDSTGKTAGFIPINKSLSVIIYDKCSNVLYTGSVGPFSQNINLGNIIVTIPGSKTDSLSGRVINCIEKT
ncbi:MAG: carboxypeptidase regulatory-like domain-containing protein [Chitinophagaceae bacterium]|nr:carboxypeptidase regulatory-like domain-containing protein [Chitinophagaceae bacterium]